VSSAVARVAGGCLGGESGPECAYVLSETQEHGMK